MNDKTPPSVGFEAKKSFSSSNERIYDAKETKFCVFKNM